MSDTRNPDQNKINQLVKKNRAQQENRDPDKLFAGLRKGDKNALSAAITLVESALHSDRLKAEILLAACLPESGKSVRIGITGVPGVGKSTFIESFGLFLISQGKKVAVLAIDPSSEKTGGSILGDKTRMVELSSNENAFIRPTANRGSLGGVAAHTRESIFLCEAAGYDIILVETVGVGQSETAVHSMTDFFLLLMLAGAGDELQGIKRGIMELADAVLITKSDGNNLKQARLAQAQYKNALHLFPANENEWIPRVELISAIENSGIEQVTEIINEFAHLTRLNGWFENNRLNQQVYWMKEAIQDRLIQDFYSDKGVCENEEAIRSDLRNQKISSSEAARKLIELYYHGKKTI